MKALSLFSGIGGIDLACEWAGIETVAFCERDKFCQKVLAKHWPDVPIFDDVTTLRGDQIGAVDLITGGYPCQPFSTAGKRMGESDERHLWPEFYRLVREIRPAWVLGENVSGHVSMGLDAVLSDLGDAGYTARAFVFSASSVGAWHKRERIFVVAHAAGIGRVRAIRAQNSPPETAGPMPAEWLQNGKLAQVGTKVARPRPGVGWEKSSARPGMVRMVDGVSPTLDRLRVLGNAVVPQQVYPILAAMKETHDLFQEAPNE